MPKTPQKPAAETQEPAPDASALEAVKAAAEPIKIAGLEDAPSPKFEMVVGDERPEGFTDPAATVDEQLVAAATEIATQPTSAPPSNYRDSEVLRREKERETKQATEFKQKLVGTLKRNIKEARAPEIVPTQPVSSHITEQTRLEMEAGRKAVTHHETLRTLGPIAPRKIDPWEGKSTPILRPGNIDEYKATFKSPAQTKDKTSGAANL